MPVETAAINFIRSASVEKVPAKRSMNRMSLPFEAMASSITAFNLASASRSDLEWEKSVGDSSFRMRLPANAGTLLYIDSQDLDGDNAFVRITGPGGFDSGTLYLGSTDPDSLLKRAAASQRQE